MDYLYLRAWDYIIFTDEVDEHIKVRNLQQARELNAPEDAVYYDAQNDKWVLFSDVTNTSMIKWINRALKQPEKLRLPNEDIESLL